ncbi:MAG: hypothetical protein Q9220_000773 [cf. Caloplaca sp. 1 TL-2023]
MLLPEYGQRLLSVELDRIASIDPDRAYLSRPRCSTDLALGFEDISYLRIANAVNRTAHWLRQELGEPREFETIAYIAAPDIRNMLLALAVSKVGFKASVLLQGNHRSAITDSRLIVTDPPALFAQALMDHRPFNTWRVPSLDQLLAEEAVPLYSFTKSFSEARNDPVLVLHTSGSTADNMMHKKPPQGRQSALALATETRVINTMPGFHAAGIGILTYFAIWIGCCSVLPPQSARPLDAAVIADTLKYANASSLIVVPSILEDIKKDPVLSDSLRNVQNVIWSGGPLPKETGETLKHMTHLTTYIGSTELTLIPHWIVNDLDDWQYLEMDECFNIEFHHFSNDLYEAVVVRSKKCEMYQPVWHIFPDLREYHTKDLYSKHPIKSSLWRYSGRTDDIIVFVNGEKFNPVTFEDLVCSHPLLNSVIVIGEGRFQAALLVEPKEPLRSMVERAHLTEKIWPLIQKANRESSAHCRVSKSHIFFTAPEKPMMRASKGTVQRRLTLSAYSEEIDSLYADAESIKNREAFSAVQELDTDALESLISRLVYGDAVCKTEDKRNDDFFSHSGIDSLRVLRLLQELRSHGFGTLSARTVYDNPTISRLANAIQGLGGASRQDIAHSSSAKLEEMQDLLKECSGPSDGALAAARPNIVLLTGSSGALGSYLLDSLIKAPEVKKIVCLNRTISAQQQIELHTARGLQAEFDSSGVEFLQGSVSSPHFGLEESTFKILEQEVTKIIHCAWPVDFNLSFQSYSSQLHGVRALIDFVASPRCPKSIFFVSSIASVGNWPSPEPVPETPFYDFSLPSPTGYAESKFLAEQLLLGSSTLIDVSICRVGQIAGPILSEKGTWKKNEWFPSLIASSKHLGLLPDSLGFGSMTEIDWMPIDVASTIIAELALLARQNSARVYHAVSPRTCPWKLLIPTVLESLGKDNKIEVVSFPRWLEALRGSGTETSRKPDFDRNPAVKLLDFFEALPGTKLPRLSTVETRKRSGTMCEMKAIRAEDMERWLRQWKLD